MSLRIRCRIEPPRFPQMLVQRNLESGGKVQLALDNAVIKYAIPYCPFDTGTLANSPLTASTPGKVVYAGPYAHYLYYGKVYGPNIPVFEDDSGTPTRWFSPPGQKKHPTGREMSYDTSVHPQAGKMWFERMKADHAEEIREAAEKIARGLDI